jgi:hypothetical protein
MIGSIRSTKRWREPSLERFLHDFLEQIVVRDLSIMERYESELNEIEDEVLSSDSQGNLARVNEICSDIRRLLVHRNDDCAGVRVKSHFGVCVTDLTDRIPGDLLEIDIRFRCDLPHDEDETGRRSRLAGHAAHRILREAGIEDGIGNRVAYFIRMPLCH